MALLGSEVFVPSRVSWAGSKSMAGRHRAMGPGA
jgi:hypothetical protein